MSILIKGMKMPENKDGKPLWIGILEDGTVADPSSSGFLIVYPHVKAIELPPHGRLIEDTVLDNMSMWNTDREYDRGWDSAVQAAKNRIKTAPTIIEAEEEVHDSF